MSRGIGTSSRNGGRRSWLRRLLDVLNYNTIVHPPRGPRIAARTTSICWWLKGSKI
jgi:hypothetical protein